MSKVVYVFIDASNLWAVQKAKGKMFDLAKLKKYLKDTHSASKKQERIAWQVRRRSADDK